PFTPLDLAPLPGVETSSAEGNDRAEQIKSLHEKVREKITKHNLQYQACRILDIITQLMI
ncbi:hypothetical protein Tco_0301470, partial [Tanacetum coccineum]